MASWNQGDTAKLATVVIAESHAPCAVPFAHLRGLAFLRQQADEDLEALSARVMRLIDRTRSEELVVQRAWLLMSAQHDEQRFATRRRIAQTLGDAVRRSHGRGLTIVAPAELSAPTRAAALSLAGAVIEGEGGAGEASVTVHVRFVGGHPAEVRDVLEEVPPPPISSTRRIAGARSSAASSWARRTG
jgi:hypothetical protein